VKQEQGSVETGDVERQGESRHLRVNNARSEEGGTGGKGKSLSTTRIMREDFTAHTVP